MDYLHEVDAHQLRTIAYKAAIEDVRETCVAARLIRYRSGQLRMRAAALRGSTRRLRTAAHAATVRPSI
jgi:hypothetical protein